eukprot:Clim_evm11s244 gene=Clim_evmTU11s244
MTASHHNLRLYVMPEKIVLEPMAAGGNRAYCLEFDRTGSALEEVRLQPGPVTFDPAMVEQETCSGLVGVIDFPTGKQLIVITGKELLFRVRSAPVYRATRFRVIPFSNTVMDNTTKLQHEALLQLLQATLDNGGFHFSYDYDLTQRLQVIDSGKLTGEGLSARANPHFFWNRPMLGSLLDKPECAQFCLPLVHGFFEHRVMKVAGREFDFLLMTRRGCERTGTRYNVRGIDDMGNVANFAETEQVIFTEGWESSFVQIRGSIPLYWNQYANIKYKPKVMIESGVDPQGPFRQHFEDLCASYGPQVLVDLIDQKGAEKNLGDNFRAECERNSDLPIRYEAFDFHKECSKMRWDRLSILMDRVLPDMQKHGFYLRAPNGEIKRTQDGTVRTNCMDCLDRTNVVQSMIARIMLETTFVEIGILARGQSISSFDSFEHAFKNVWADNADAVSLHYSGTGALKTDFTRTGKRTMAGLLADGYNSAVRYYKNNFMDGFRQDSLDLFLGKAKAADLSQEQLQGLVHRPAVSPVPLVLLALTCMILLTLILPSENYMNNMMYLVLWLGALAGTWKYLTAGGYRFVDTPILLGNQYLPRQNGVRPGDASIKVSGATGFKKD